MKKEHIVTVIYKVRNQINELTGKPLVDLTDTRMKDKMHRESFYNSKFELENRLTIIQEEFERTHKSIAHEKRVADFYATPNGIEHKAQAEEAIERKIAEWQEYEGTTIDLIEIRIQKDLGEHWGVSRFNKGFLEIGVVNAEKSSADRREFYFGQTIDIHYEEKKWGVGTEVFESGCCSCGSFAVAGGDTIGERAMFYVGIGQFYGNAELVDFIRKTLKDSARQIEVMSKELDNLRRMLSHPISDNNDE